jgi:hypothetical protein
MEKGSVADALRALATDDQSRPETARLRDVIDEVEAALKAGISRSDILETLHREGGFTMTLKSFESALYRIRKQRKKRSETENQENQRRVISNISESDQPIKQVQQAINTTPQEATDSVESLKGKDAKQRREATANLYIKDVNNPLFRRKQEKNK